ncbi:hypothetical protein WR25_24644 [Diploscapter pachys]|uniref:Uncharacterized protein n=1 Tax=Diploscapter pachys TaxID=2018661 RepID=A0A2A2K2Y1_9BILA|nr:hypothetical protein WR25_24644 [Diploscapter pachys]
MPLIRQAPGTRCRQRASHAGQAEQPDLGVIERQRRGAQGQHHRAPQHAERREDQHRKHTALTNNAMANASPAATTYTPCQPSRSASAPETKRADRMPSTTPLVTVPTACPC